jgi:hypothetical protein
MRYLVRHAHAGSQKRWRGPDQLRPLSALGDRQAVGLLARCGGYPVTRILSSPTVRCHQTVVPLSQERAVPIEVVAALDVDAPVEGLLELMADPSMETTILCGHGGQIVGASGCSVAGRPPAASSADRKGRPGWSTRTAATCERSATCRRCNSSGGPPDRTRRRGRNPGSQASSIRVAVEPWAAGQPGTGIAEHDLIAEITVGATCCGHEGSRPVRKRS